MQKDRLTPEWVREMLCKQGRIVTMEEARLILEFLQKMAEILVSAHLKR